MPRRGKRSWPGPLARNDVQIGSVCKTPSPVLLPRQRRAKRLRAVLVPPSHSTIVPRYVQCPSIAMPSPVMVHRSIASSALFFWPGRGPSSFRQDEKKMGGAMKQLRHREQEPEMRIAAPVCALARNDVQGRGGAKAGRRGRRPLRPVKDPSSLRSSG